MKKDTILCNKYEFDNIVAFINTHLAAVIGEEETKSLTRSVYDPGTPAELWCLESVAAAMCWAKEIEFSPVQRAGLCLLLWNERMTPTFADIAFEAMALRGRESDVERVWDDYTILLDERLT